MTITAIDYARRIGYSPSAITKRLKSQKKAKYLPGAVSVKKFGNTWLIELVEPFHAATVAKQFKQNGKNIL